MNADIPTVRIQLLPEHPAAAAPNEAEFMPAREGDAGIDLVACESIVLAPGERAPSSLRAVRTHVTPTS